MIGQGKLLQSINKLIDDGFPRFVVITGQRGQGKKTLANYISHKLNYQTVKSDIKIDELRNIIELAYQQTEPIIYLIPDADKMSLGAKNSLLKVIEEPPNNAYFIMTLQTIDNTLPTIKSRCIELRMDNYSDEELNKFVDMINPNIDNLERIILTDIGENYYEIDTLNRYGANQFYEYVQKVVNNIYKVSSANSFKLAEKINLKDDDSKYDLELFLRTFKIICMDNILQIIDLDEHKEEFKNYAMSIDATRDIIDQLSITGINKQSLIDIWILNVRKIWRN